MRRGRKNAGIIGIVAGIILLVLFLFIGWWILSHLVTLALAFTLMLLPMFMIVIMAILAKKFLLER